MKLKTFSVENYRSISKAEKLHLTAMTVLVGPNNEGKSNILRALVLGLNILSRIETSKVFTRGFLNRSNSDITSYDWKRDFPIAKQKAPPSGKTIFDFEFELTEVEKQVFFTETGSDITGYLPVRLSIGPDQDISFEFRKKGRHSAAISKKRDPICRFIRSHIAYEYVRSVRTAKDAMRVVNEILSKELESIEDDPNFRKAFTQLEALQKPIRDAVSKTVEKTLRQFLQDVKSVSVVFNQEEGFQALRESCRIYVDDGTQTDLRMKGDGIQSLASIALIRHASESSAKGKNLILAVEEPETHLHPDAIHELKKVLNELALQHQVILTTHNPILVNKGDIKSNVIVEDHRAKPANSLAEIRQSLGVRMSDNLKSADLVLVLEGEEDIAPIKALLKNQSPQLTSALNNGRLALDTLGGASKLTYKLGLLRDLVYEYHVYMDNDTAGKNAVQNAKDAGLLTASQYTMVQCPGMNASEIEDIYAVTLYSQYILGTYNVTLTDKNLGNKGVWSDRVKTQFAAQAGNWATDGSTELELKRKVSEFVARNPTTALAAHRRSSFDALVKILERRISKLVS